MIAFISLRGRPLIPGGGGGGVYGFFVKKEFVDKIGKKK